VKAGQLLVGVAFSLLLAYRAEATYISIDPVFTDATHLTFDIVWSTPGTEHGDLVLDDAGLIEWMASPRDNYAYSSRLIDVNVRAQDPLNPTTQIIDSWSFYVDEQRHYVDAQRQSSDPLWATRTFTLFDDNPFAARVTYARHVPDAGLGAGFVGAIFAGLFVLHRKWRANLAK